MERQPTDIEAMYKSVTSFFKEAFCVDGNVRIITKERDTSSFKIESIVELNDSKRGRFYIASIRRII